MTAIPPLLESETSRTHPSRRPPVSRRILVTDGDQRAALALVRSLGRLGHDVYVCSTTAESLAGASRYCRDELRVSDPLRQPIEFVRDVEGIVQRYGID